MTYGPADRVIGGLRILPPAQTEAATLLVLVHGWGGNTGGTWGRTPALLVEGSPRAVDVGLFHYQSGIWWLGRKLQALDDGQKSLREGQERINEKLGNLPCDHVAQCLPKIIEVIKK